MQLKQFNHRQQQIVSSVTVVYLGNSMSLKIDDTGNPELDTPEHRDNLQNVVIERRRYEVLKQRQ